MLDHQAENRPNRVALRFLAEGGVREITFGALDRARQGVARALAGGGVGTGDRVVLALPNGEAYCAGFFGSQRAGAVPVPLASESGAGRIADLAGRCGAETALVPAGWGREGAGELSAAGLRVLALGADGSVADGADGNEAAEAPLPAPPRPEATAFIQYTSGSTGEPKGVVLTHRQVVTNLRQMIAGMEITAGDVFVSWLPQHHDMGLVLMTLVPLALAAPLVLLPSRLADVRPWLRAIGEHRGTFTAAPDFAYRLCLSAVREPGTCDLSSLRVALDAAEPVRAETLRRFEERFGLERVMVAGYGLAEATVGVSMQPPGTPPAVDERGLVSLGRPFPGVTMEIVRADGEPGEAPAAGEVGEIAVASPAATEGYFADPQATAGLFVRPGAIRTGDLGYRNAAGDVFLVGRSKNIILQAGRNLAPVELEAAAETVDGVRRAAAVGIDRRRSEGEQAYVFAEISPARLRRRGDRAALEPAEIARRIVVAVDRRLGLRPGRVVLLTPRSIPRTANGKLRYPELRRAWSEGRLRAEGRVLWP